LLNVISDRETNTHLNLDTVLGNTGVGFYASFTWWSYLISSLSCVQGIAKAMYEYKTLNSTGSVQTIQLLLVLCKFIVYCIFFVTNTVMVSKFLNSNILELVFFVASLTIMFHLSSKLLTYVFSYDCSWIKSLSDVPKLQYGDTGKLIKYRKMEQPIVRSKETAVIFSSKNEQIMVGRKSVRLISIMSGFKSCAEIVLVGCAFLWLIDSVSNPYKFYLKKEGLRLFFGSGGKKFLYLNLASVVVTMLGFSENFSVILSPLVFLLYLCFEHREDILLYFGKDIQNFFYGSQELSTIVYHFPGMSRYINLELFSLISLLLMEYVLAFLQLSSSRILGKFYTATFRFLNIYLIYMAIFALKTFVENLPKFMYSSVITWFFLAFVTRTTIGCSALVKTSSITKDGDNNFFSVAKNFLPTQLNGIRVVEVEEGHSNFAKFLIKIMYAVLAKVGSVSKIIGAKVLELRGKQVTGTAGFKKGVKNQFDYSKANILRMRKMCPMLGEVSHNDMFGFEVNGCVFSASHVVEDKIIYDTNPDEVLNVVSRSEDLEEFLMSVGKRESFRDTYTDQVSFGSIPEFAEPPNGMPVFTPTPDGEVKLGIVRDCVTSTKDDEGTTVTALGSKRIFYPHVKQGMSGLPIISPVGIVGSCGTHEVVPTELFPSVVESVPGIKEFSGLCRIPVHDIKASEVMHKACQAIKYSRFDVVAQTGSGKSTVFPIKLSVTNGGRKVIVVTPRVSAAINAYTRIILLIEEAGLNINCGLVTGPRKEGTLSADILIFTVGSFLFLLGFGGIDLEDMDVILDEVHVHEGPTMCVLQVLEEKLKKKQLARLFTATATPIGCSIGDLNPDADNFPIEMVQIDCDSTVDNHLMSNLSNVCKTVMKHSGKVNMVFLPTITSLSIVEKKLIEVNAELVKVRSTVQRLKVFKVHSMNMISQLPGIRRRIHGLRKVSSYSSCKNHVPISEEEEELSHEKLFILTTNCLETGVTLDLDVVFCSGLVVSERYDGISTLSLFKRTISTQEFIQQRGRVGRVKPGKCVYFSLKKNPYINRLSYLPGDIDAAYSWLTFLGYGDTISSKNLLAKELASKDYLWHKNVLLSPFRPIVSLYHTTPEGKFKESALDILKMSKSPGDVLVGSFEDDDSLPLQQVRVNLGRFSTNDVDIFSKALLRFGIPIEGKIDKKATIHVSYHSKFLMSSLHILQIALIASKVEANNLAIRKSEQKVKQGIDGCANELKKGSNSSKNKDKVIKTSLGPNKNTQEKKKSIGPRQIVLIVERIPLEKFLTVSSQMGEFLEDIFKISVKQGECEIYPDCVGNVDIADVSSAREDNKKPKNFEKTLIEKLRKYNAEQEQFSSFDSVSVQAEVLAKDLPIGACENVVDEQNQRQMDFLDALKQRYAYPNRKLQTSKEYLRDWVGQLQFSHVGLIVMMFLLILGLVIIVSLKSLLEVYEFLKLWFSLSNLIGFDVGMYVRVLIAFWYSTYFQKTSSYISKEKTKILFRMSECLDSIKVVRRTSPVTALASHMLVYKLAKREGKKVAAKWREKIEPQLRLAGGGLNIKSLSRDCDAIIDKTGIQESIDQALFSTAFDPKLLVLLLAFSPLTVLISLVACVILKLIVFEKTATPIIWILYSFPFGAAMTSIIQGKLLASLLFMLSIFTSHIDGFIGEVATTLVRGFCLTTSTSSSEHFAGTPILESRWDTLDLYHREILNNDQVSQIPLGLLIAEPLDKVHEENFCYVPFQNVKRKYGKCGPLSNNPVADLNLFAPGEKRQGIVASYFLEKCAGWFPDCVIDVTAGKNAEFCRAISRRRKGIRLQALTRERQVVSTNSEVPIRQLKPGYNIEVEGIPKPLVREALYVISYSRQYPPNQAYISQMSPALSQLLLTLRQQRKDLVREKVRILLKVDEFLCMQKLNLLVNLAQGSYPSACLDPLKPFELPTLWIHLDFSKKRDYQLEAYENWFAGLSILQRNRAEFQGSEVNILRKREAILSYIRTRDMTFDHTLSHNSEALFSRTPDIRCTKLPSLKELGIGVPKGEVFFQLHFVS
jgi:hypothetical protein